MAGTGAPQLLIGGIFTEVYIHVWLRSRVMLNKVRSLGTGLILLGLIASPCARQAAAQTPSPNAESQRLFAAGQSAEAAGDSLNAYFLYSRAAELDPADIVASLQAKAVGSRLMQTAVTTRGADPAALFSVDFYSKDLPPEVREARRIVVEGIAPSEAIEEAATAPVPRFKPFDGTKDFDLRGNIRPLIEEVLGAYGIKPIFEQNFPNGNPVNFRVGDLTRDEALRALETVTGSFFVALRDDTALVLRDTNDNRNNFAPVVTAVIPIPERFAVQEAQELQTAVQTILEIRRIGVDAGRHLLILRDQEYKILAARRLIDDLLRLRTQVQLDVELILVSRNSSLSYGLSLPNAWRVLSLENPLTIASLANLATSWYGIGLGDAAAVATLTRNSSQATLREQMITLDGQQVTLHIGDQYPVVTGRGGFGTIETSIPTTQYRDLGLKLTITPVVHAEGEVTLTVEADYNALSGGTNNGIPIIANRKFQGTARLRGGQWTVITGLATAAHTHITNGIAGLADIPVLGHLFRRETVSDDAGQILLLVKPRLLSTPAWEKPSAPVWMGTETHPPTFY